MALKELRGASRSWIAGIFVALLVISFAAWGVADIFRNPGGRGVARIGGAWIGTIDFQERLRMAADRKSRDVGKRVTLAEAQAMGLPARVLDQMVDEQALDNVARKIGLGVHDETLKRLIRSTPAFQGPDGRFNAETYKSLLAQNHLTPEGYQAAIRADIVRSQLQDAIMSGTQMPRGLIENLLSYRAEMREVSYVMLEPSFAGDIAAPDKPTLEKFVATDKAAYSTPELRSFVVLVFRPADFIARIQVSDSELMENYKFHEKEYAVPEQRDARTVAFANEAETRDAMTLIESHKKTLEEIGRGRGLKDEELAFKASTKKDIPDPVVADAVFASQAPGPVGPINGALAWTIAEVKSITPGRTRTFDEMKDEIRKNLAKSRVDDLIDETVNKFEDARAGGATFEETALKLNLTLVKYEAVDAQGRDHTGKPIMTQPEAPDLLKAAFQAEAGADLDPQPMSEGGQFVVRLDNVAPPALKPFEEIEAQAHAAYDAKERKARLEAKAKALVAAHAKDGMGAVAAELGLAPVTLPAPLHRSGDNQILSADLVDGLFQARPQTLVAGEGVADGKVVIATVLKVDRPSATELAQGVQAVSGQVDVSLAQDAVANYINAARSRLNVKINQSTLDQATTNSRL
jgi:peptidyl-prolyl cis-trans isomerase D